MTSLTQLAGINSGIGTSLPTQSKNAINVTPPPGSISISAIVPSAAIAAASSVLSALSSLSPSSLNVSKVAALAASLGNSMANTAINSTINALTQIKSPITDPIQASLGAQNTAATPSTFITSKLQAQITPINFSTTSSTAAINIAKQNSSQLAVLSARLGLPVPTNDAALAALQSVAFTSAVSVLSGAILGNNPPIPVITPITVPVSTISAQQAAFIQNNASLLSNVPNASSILSNNWNSSYPSVLGTNGLPISGIPTGTDPGLINNVNSLASSMCEDYPSLAYSSFGNTQSLVNTLLSLIFGNNLTAMFGGVTSCPTLFTPQSQSYIVTQLPSLALSGSGTLAAAAINAVGGGVVPAVNSLIESLAGQSNPEAGMATSIGTIMTATNTTPAMVYGAGMYGSTQAWNATSINAGNSAVLGAVIATDTVSLANGLMALAA